MTFIGHLIINRKAIISGSLHLPTNSIIGTIAKYVEVLTVLLHG